MYAKPADRALVDLCVKVGSRRRGRIERHSIIADSHREALTAEGEGDIDHMSGGVGIAIADRVGEQFIEDEIDGMSGLISEPPIGAELVDDGGDAADLGKIVLGEKVQRRRSPIAVTPLPSREGGRRPGEGAGLVPAVP